MKVNCNKVKIYTINPKATPKIPKQSLIVNKPIKEIKQNKNNLKKRQKKRIKNR